MLQRLGCQHMCLHMSFVDFKGGRRTVPRGAVGGGESCCHSCQEGDDHAKGHSPGEKDSSGEGMKADTLFPDMCGLV